MTAAAYQTAQAVENGSDNKLTLVVPAGAAAGQLAYAHVSYYHTVATITGITSGWTQVDDRVDGDTGSRVYSKTLGPGDPGSNVVINFSAVNKAAGTIVTVTGKHDTTAWAPLTSLTTSLATPSITAAEDDSLVIDFLANKQGTPADFVAPGTRTIRAQAYNASGGVNASGAGTAVIASAGTVSSVTYTQPASTHGGVLSVMVGPLVNGAATYDLTAVYATDTTTPITGWVLDATGSTGTVSLTQTAGTTASVTESPTGVFTITNPSGTDALTFDLDAAGDTTDTAVVSIGRSATAERPAIWTKTASGWF